MKKEFKDPWIAALRSGKYKQAKRVLRVGDSFCCLGVLCDINPELVEQKKLTHSNTVHTVEEYVFTFKNEKEERAILPRSFRKFVEITSSQEGDCTNMNDNAGASFEEIADYIERNM